MKPLRIGYEVSFCAELHGVAASATGVGRVVESVALRLAARPEVELKMTGCYGSDPRPAFTSARARRYWQARWSGGPIAFLEAARSRSGLFPLYREALLDANEARNPGPARRLWRKGLNAFSRWDARPGRFQGAFDLFHSPFHPLPPRAFTGTMPRVLTVHDLIPLKDPLESHARQMTEAALASLDPARDWALCVSDHTRRALCAATGLPPERAAVAPLAAEPGFRPCRDDAALERLLARAGAPPGPFFLCVANPQPRKNLPRLVRAFAQIAAELPRHALLLAGAARLGSGVEAVEAELAALPPKVRARVVRLGGVPDEELPLLYSLCDAFVFPSLDEGFGLPPLEAMQCGAPVIASNAASLPEVTGDAALLIDPLDEGALATALRQTALDPNLRARLSEAGLRRAAAFSWEKTADAVLALYRKALA